VQKRVGGEILHGTVNKQASWRRKERWHPPSNQEWEIVKVVVGGKLHRRGGKCHFPREL
jgi:hypothetical protein